MPVFESNGFAVLVTLPGAFPFGAGRRYCMESRVSSSGYPFPDPDPEPEPDPDPEPLPGPGPFGPDPGFPDSPGFPQPVTV
ncbi:MAG TPA: hypothetical protein VGD59_03695 [Acidisarcina sp.]